ncbi:MAG: signal recognition particle protein [Gemmatimonadetes bacterium]|nr:signal recognition particle protein [Gemmatimonadota bacterium]MBT8402441.1 signal recognition particle protein [Gemmatimonadota bacterium]NNK65019.1 signal recognition particle protein [Gemmatimonadota bacterium]
MFEELSDKLDGVLSRFRQRGVLTEPMIREGLREIRRVLLEADVNFKVTREFLGRVQERALGEDVVKSVSPGQQIVKIVHDELAGLLGDGKPSISWVSSPPTILMVVGLQGSGKTTTSAKLARLFAREGRKPMLAACDLQRPAAIEQLQTLGRQIEVPVHSGTFGGDPVETARAAVEAARDQGRSVLIVDTAGRLQIDEALMAELGRIRDALGPQEILLVADAMTGQEAVRIAEGFDEALDLTGVVLTKMDGDARGGAALSIRGVTGKPIKFVGVGETVDDLDTADPERLAGRILQMGDVVGLVERAQRSMDVEEQAKLQEKVLGKGRFTLEDFLTAMRQIQRMGPLDQLLKLIPGAGRLKIPGGQVDPKRMKHVEAIILSMTPLERENPKIINGSRRARIAKGSGRPVSEINRLLKQFKEMQKFMKQMKGFGGGMPGMPGMPFGR